MNADQEHPADKEYSADRVRQLAKRVIITLGLIGAPFILGLLFTYQVIRIDWVSFMEVQPSYRPMEDPRPLPVRSVPVEGAAFVPDVGSPQNPLPADNLSLERGKYLYDLNCSLCHGPQGTGNGSVAISLLRKPADLTSQNASREDDGTIFLVITNGISGLMPPIKENLDVRDRWEVVNYVRSLQKQLPGKLPALSGASRLDMLPGAISCQVRALDLIGAWVKAGTPEKEPFVFTDANGATCQGTFLQDILVLFTESNVWYTGAIACSACHGPDLKASYAQMNLSDYAGILAGSRRPSAEASGNDILGVREQDWEKARLFQVLFTKWMPLGRPADSPEKGPLLHAGKPQ